MTGRPPGGDDPVAFRASGTDARPSLGCDEDAVPTLVSAAWVRAEATLYPALTDRPDLYQRAMLLVRATVERLRDQGSSTRALLAASEQGPQLVLDVAGRTARTLDGLDPGQVAHAALAMRHREVRSEQAALRRARVLNEARADGQAWVVLEEAGSSDGDPFVPYRRLEVETATGRGLLVTTDADEEYRTVTHTVRLVLVDRLTGGVRDTAGENATVLGDASAREEAVARLKGIA